MYFQICFQCDGSGYIKGQPCPMHSKNWSDGLSSYDQAFSGVSNQQLIIGDPTNFIGDGFERGWDLEDVVIGDLICEYDQKWQNKMVKNPSTGNTVKVGSLEPEDQEKYKPDSSGDSNGDSSDGNGRTKHKVVNGGVVVNKDITPVGYRQKTRGMTLSASMRNKRWNSLFDVFHDASGVFHLFHRIYDKSEFDSGAVNPERANKIRHVGAFKTADLAKSYALGGNVRWDLPQHDRKTLAAQEPWTAKQMGV